MRPHTLNSPSWNAVCRKESSKSRHRPSAQHWGSPPTTSSQLLGVFRPLGTKREDREGQAMPSSLWWGGREQTELCVSSLRGCSPAGSDLNPKPGAAQPLPHSLSAPSCLFTVPSKLSTAGTTFISGTASQSPEPMALRCAQGDRLLGYFPTSGPKGDPACSFLQPCSNDPAPGKAGGAVLGLENRAQLWLCHKLPWDLPHPSVSTQGAASGRPTGLQGQKSGGVTKHS